MYNRTEIYNCLHCFCFPNIKNDVRKLCNQSFLTSYFGLRDSHGVGGNTIWDQDGCVEWQVA